MRLLSRMLPALLLPLSFACAASWKSDLGNWFKQAQPPPAGATALDNSQIVSGLREALAQGTTKAINQLGRTDGFWGDAAVRIPLPSPLSGIENSLRQFGQGPRLDEFQLTLNRAAERAVPQVADIFGNAVRQMSVADARAILDGPQDAATRYFQRTASDSLRVKILPIVRGATAGVGVTQSYKQLSAKAGPLLQLSGHAVPDLDNYVTDKALAGLFTTIAAEEARIRTNPAARGTELLKQVFGSH
ncbi:DUF4197 domain-containing protein [Solimonas terrae]|uniref:DUF4197 domain-containing protein n=1 Tax=Solimonas terrae TaxID=1396819 RepID=UPI003F4F8CA5